MGPTQDQNQLNQAPINKPKPKTKTFIGLVVIVLLVVGASAYAWKKINNNSTTSTDQEIVAEQNGELPANATMAIEVGEELARVGEIVEFEVYVDSGDTEVNAVGVEATYPKDDLEVVEVVYEGSKFDIQAFEKAEAGTITLERGASKPTKGKSLVATLRVRPITARTTADITLADKSSLMATANAQNVLGERKSVQIEIAGNE